MFITHTYNHIYIYINCSFSSIVHSYVNNPEGMLMTFQQWNGNTTHMLHVWNIYQHLPEQNRPNVGKEL